MANRQAERRLRHLTRVHAAATAELRELRQQLREQAAVTTSQTMTLLQTMTTAIIAENHQRQIVLVNQRLCDLLGLPEPPAAYVGRTHAELLGSLTLPAADPTYPRRMAAAVRDQARVSELITLTSGRVVQQEYLPITQDDQTVLHLWSFEDVTEREQAQEKIRQFSLLTQQSPSPFIRFGRDGQVQLANPAAEPVLTALAKPTEQDAHQFLRREMARALAHNEIRTAERRLDGCFYVWKVVPLPAEDAAILYLTDITDRRQAEAELLQSQLFIARINDTVPSLVFLFDLDQRALTYCNRQAELLLGYTEAELKDMGSTVVERMVLPADREAVRQQQPLEAAFRQPKQPVTLDLRLRHRGGAWRWFRVQLTPFLRQPNGAASQLIGSAQDITSARATEEELRHSRLLMERVASTAPNLIYIYDVRRNAGVYMNPYAVTALGYTQAEIQAMGAGAGERLFAPSERARLLEHYQQLTAAADGEVHTVELYVYHRNGSIRWLRCNNTPFERDAQGRVRLVLGTAEDITQWKIADEQRRLANGRLAEQNRLFRQVIDTAPPLIYLKDCNGNYILANQATAQLYGLTPGVLVRTPYAQLSAHPDDLARYLAHDQEVLRQEQRIAQEETFTRPDGEVRWFYSIKQPFVLADGTVQVLGVSSNITDLKRTQQELRAAKEAAEANARAKQEFLANMSHEIRTPMNGILGIANLLAKTPLDEQQSEYLGHIQHSAESLLVIINDVLDMAQLDAGKIIPESTAFDLREVLRAGQQLIRPKAAEKGVALDLDLPPARVLTTVLGDPYRLRQVLLNLLSNAVKFTAQGRVLLSCRRLSATQEATVFRFSVQDTGIGIAPEQLPTMFEPFTQASSSTAREYGGSGLGLSIARRLVELLGGTMGVRSQPGEGSTFYFDLPFTYAELPGPPAVSEPPPRYHTLGKRRVLLAEDNMVNQFLVETILRNWGMTVDTASSGSEALRLFQLHPYDVVLMDIQMPGMDGVQATRQLRQHPDPARAATPVVALTAHALPAEADYYRAAGLDAYLSKPFREEDLFHTVSALLQRRPAPPLPAPAPAAPDPAPAPEAAPLYDLSGIRRLAHGNEAFVKRLVHLFIRTTPPCVRELEEHLAAQNWPKLSTTAHHLKSSLDGMLVRSLHGVIRQLEASHPAPPDGAALAPLVQQVRQVTEAVIGQLEREFPEA